VKNGINNNKKRDIFRIKAKPPPKLFNPPFNLIKPNHQRLKKREDLSSPLFLRDKEN